MYGTVKFYNKDKGYGFIYTDSQEKDFFFGIGDWKNQSVPNAGDDVEFETAQAKKGEKAVNIKLHKAVENKKQEQFNKNDSRVNCPRCSKKIVPRIITNRGTPEKSVCPYCAAVVCDFGVFPIRAVITIVIIVGIILYNIF